MKILLTLLLALSMSVSISAQQAAPDSLPTFFDPLDSLQNAIDMSLLALKMHRGDLTFRGDYLEEDAYRLPLINNYMKEPLKMIAYAGEKLEIGDWAMTNHDYFAGGSHASSSPESIQPGNAADSLFTQITRQRFGPELVALINKIAALSAEVDPKNWDKLGRYSKARQDSLIEGFTLLLEENVEDEFRSVDQLDSIAQNEDAWAERLVTLANGLQGRGRLFDRFAGFLANDLPSNNSLIPRRTSFLLQTDYGQIAIGDSSDNHYEGELFLIIDSGGNDTYDIACKGTGHQTYIIDFSGNDTYNFPKNRISPYFFGSTMIVDYRGDDTYSAGSWTLGAGLFGVGILWDKVGNDKYLGDTFTEGAGCFGVGILRDDGGNDLYQAALYAQGFGFVDGIGILADSSGNDNYFAGGKYKDILRYKDHYLSLSQGFAYGIRPKMSAGIGLLIDKGGSDSYISDIFGQGASYWYGLGVLADGAGNDQYVSYQYAQGAATHMTLGILYDLSGDDVYSAKGVSQGCGHDRAAGMLIDLDGNDNYNAYDLSQAAGSANGLGLLADIRGNDAFIVRSNQNTQGFGQPRRDYGSIGIFIDLGGKDGYAGGVGHDSTWWSGSKWGVGIDQ